MTGKQRGFRERLHMPAMGCMCGKPDRVPFQMAGLAGTSREVRGADADSVHSQCPLWMGQKAVALTLVAGVWQEWLSCL